MTVGTMQTVSRAVSQAHVDILISVWWEGTGAQTFSGATSFLCTSGWMLPETNLALAVCMGRQTALALLMW